MKYILLFNLTNLWSSFIEPMISGSAFPLFYIEFFVSAIIINSNNKVSPERVNGDLPMNCFGNPTCEVSVIASKSRKIYFINRSLIYFSIKRGITNYTNSYISFIIII